MIKDRNYNTWTEGSIDNYWINNTIIDCCNKKLNNYNNTNLKLIVDGSQNKCNKRVINNHSKYTNIIPNHTSRRK